MTFISCHRIWLWEVLEITVCKNNCEVCDVFLWSLRCCFIFLFVLRFFFFFWTFCGKQQEILCLYAPMYPSVAAHTRVQCTHEHTQQDRHTRTHTHTHSFYYANFHVAAIRLPWRKLLVFVTLGTGGTERGGSVKKSETMLHLGTTPSTPPVLFLLGTPRLEFILIFSSSWQRFYLHCFNLYLFCTLKITLRKGCGDGEGGSGEWGIGSCISSAAKQKLLCKCRVQRWRWQWKCAQVTKAKKERRSGEGEREGRQCSVDRGWYCVGVKGSANRKRISVWRQQR